MAWRRWTDAGLGYWRIYTTLDLDELTQNIAHIGECCLNPWLNKANLGDFMAATYLAISLK